MILSKFFRNLDMSWIFTSKISNTIIFCMRIEEILYLFKKKIGHKNVIFISDIQIAYIIY